jgi:hypothetical protein
MNVREAATVFLEYHKTHSKEHSIRGYTRILSRFCEEFGSENLEAITTERMLPFLNLVTEGKNSSPNKPATPSCWLF